MSDHITDHPSTSSSGSSSLECLERRVGAFPNSELSPWWRPSVWWTTSRGQWHDPWAFFRASENFYSLWSRLFFTASQSGSPRAMFIGIFWLYVYSEVEKLSRNMLSQSIDSDSLPGQWHCHEGPWKWIQAGRLPCHAGKSLSLSPRLLGQPAPSNL